MSPEARSAGRAILVVAALCASPVLGQDRPGVERAYQDVIGAGTNEEMKVALDRYKALLPRVDGYYLVEGDLLRTDREIETDFVFARARQGVLRHLIGPELLVALKPNGARDFWRDTTDRTITYSVKRSSFPSSGQADEVVTRLRAAADDWERLCPECGVSFVFRDDPSPSHSKVTFIVRYVDTGGLYAAAAFFPSYAPQRRYLNVDRTFFLTRADKTGVLRHELGHTLGYRHEHIRGVPGCVREGIQWEPLTPYDPKSVMHYVCGGGGDLQLQLTELDREGHRDLYGATPRVAGLREARPLSRYAK
jgi:hypothetical protein